MPAGLVISPSQVKKAGRILKHGMRATEDDEFDIDAWLNAYDVLLAYRAAHSAPLAKATNGLRSVVRTEGCRVEVSQRLKRVPTILEKLVREPNLPLSSMQDIGGCRAILSSMSELRRVQARLSRNRPPVRVSDYIVAPRSSGYRGVHVVVQYDGRTIEAQLRTHVMHEWAITVERVSGRLEQNLKSDGDHVVQRLMAVISEAMATEEEGGIVPAALLTEMHTLREAANPYLSRGG